MSSDHDRSLDLLGAKPVAKAVDRVAEGVVAGAGAFLSRICLPVAEEFGLLLKDRVSRWRATNAASILTKAERLTESEKGTLEAHPQIVWDIIEKGSWAEDEVIQEMWAGLLASSCRSGKGDSDLHFTLLLNQLTSLQVRVLAYACEVAPKFTSIAGLPYAEEITVAREELEKITGVTDFYRIDRELDHLRSLDLIDGGFVAPDWHEVGTVATIRVTTLALHLVVRGKGCGDSPVLYWKMQSKKSGQQSETDKEVS
jgi:hypothetical protein